MDEHTAFNEAVNHLRNRPAPDSVVKVAGKWWKLNWQTKSLRRPRKSTDQQAEEQIEILFRDFTQSIMDELSWQLSDTTYALIEEELNRM